MKKKNQPKVRKYFFDGQMMSAPEICERYPAYTKEMIYNAMRVMDPKPACLADLARWEFMAKERSRMGSRISAALHENQICVSPKSGNAEFRQRKHDWAMRQLGRMK